MKPLLVCAGVIRKNDCILIAQRKENSRFGSNKWEFPGGKIEFLESPEECLCRELQEELGITVKDVELFTVKNHIYRDKEGKVHIVLLVYTCILSSGFPVGREGQNIQWIKGNKLASIQWCDADSAIAHDYLKFIKKHIS